MAARHDYFLGLAVSLAFSGKIQLLCLGDSMALSLGVKVKQVRMLCLVCASASAAAVVSFAGLLGFVGLMVPHISRKLAEPKPLPCWRYPLQWAVFWC